MMRLHILIVAILFFSELLTGCSTMERLSEVGSPPPLTPIQNPTHAPGYQRINMPMPEPETPHTMPSSLWRIGSRGFLQDSRASRVGDIVTVVINIKDAANLNDQSSRSRSDSGNSSLRRLLGLEKKIGDLFPGANADSLLDSTSTLNDQGNGSIQRSENISTRMAAVVTQVLPNGNLVISGTQETRINFEIRVLKVAGVIRPQDIDSNNEINYSNIAEARVSYGGRGQITDVQQPPIGSQIASILLPF